MKKLLMLLAMISTMGVAQEKKAKVYFISYAEIQTGIKSFSNVANRYLEMDGKNVCGLKRNGLYATLEVEPGVHEFSTVFKNQNPTGAVSVKLEPGESYYFAYFNQQPIWELMPSTGQRIILQKDIQKAGCDEVELD